MTEPDRHYYLFGVIPAGQPVPDLVYESFRALRQKDLVALVEAVPAREFSTGALEQSMASLDWVARLARKHQSVLEWAMQYGPVVPARLCTLYSSADGVRTALASNRERLVGLLGRLEGCQEWGIKMRCDENHLKRFISASGTSSNTDGRLSGGAAWILAKQADARVQGAMDRRIDEILDDVEIVVDPLVVSIRELALPPDGLRDDGQPIVLNLAVLLRTTERPAFDAAVGMLESRYGDEGVTFETTGPWPAYSFCVETERAAGDEDRGPCDSEGTCRTIAQSGLR